MDRDFWEARWARNEIGFHLGEVNPYLIRHWSTLDIAPGAGVLVPLCGKSLDLAWLACKGYQVVGVELAEKAVEDFFAAQGVEPEVEVRDGLRVFRHGTLTIFQGDFFDLKPEHVAGCEAVYDRAALIALPPDLRVDYVRHLSAILPQTLRGLLVALEYDQAQMDGPPFSVPAAEVREHFSGAWSLRELERGEVLEENPRFAQRGLSRLAEVVYRLERT